MADTLITVAVALGVSFVLGELFFRMKYPRVIGQILAGVILGLPLFSSLFGGDISIDIDFLSHLGVIFLLLISGMQLNLHKLKRAEKDTFILALFSVIVPFVMGYVLMRALGYTNLVALVVGASLSLTAEGTTLKVLLEMKALNTRIGVVLLGAGILDDIFEVIFLSGVLAVAQGAYLALATLPLKLVVFVLVTYITYKTLPALMRAVQRERSRVATVSFIILFGLVIASLSTELELGPIIGAFIAGIIIHLSDHHKYEFQENVRELEAMTFAFIIPFFFINIGLHFDFTALADNFYLAFLIFMFATIGKLAGAFLATPFTKLNLRQTHLIGWGMNSRGAIELVIAELARSNGIIPIEVYNGIVLMAVATTVIFPFMMRWMIKTDRKILK